MLISSSAFAPGGPIPARYTCDGANASPPLQWSEVPPTAHSLALILEDPDAPDPAAPKAIWTHWILYNIPPSVHRLAENAAGTGLPPGTLEGLNDWGRTGYGGPCPPVGRHRYLHRLYALDVMLPELGGPRRAALLRAMSGKILAEALLLGVYSRAPSGR